MRIDQYSNQEDNNRITFISECKELIICNKKCIGGVMINVLTSSVVDRVFEPRLGQTKDYKIGICCFSA